MTDMPKVNPRSMHTLIQGVADSHASVRDSIVQAAQEREAYYAEENQRLNAKARLEGKTAP